MKEHPIIFSLDSVIAILNNKKSQTRRVIKPQPETEIIGPLFYTPEVIDKNGLIDAGTPIFGIHDYYDYGVKFPYGAIGDSLWVRETFAVQSDIWERTHDLQQIYYPANSPGEQFEGYVFKPAIFMPRWASRITLDVINVRVERVQDISAEDVMAEGVCQTIAYSHLWNSLNAKRGYGWDVNPWVWVIDFKVHQETLADITLQGENFKTPFGQECMR